MKKLFQYLFILFLCFNNPVFSHEDEPTEEPDSAVLNKIKLNSQQQEILHIRTKAIKLTEIQPSMKINGIIEEIPNLHFQLNSPVRGKITNINVSLGSQVQKGQILAIIESQEVIQLSASGETDQANYRSQLAQAKANLELERKHFEREKSLYEHKINTQKDLEAAENSLQNAKASLKAAEQNLIISINSTQKRLNQIGGTKNGQVYLKAPMNGQISEINMTLGQNVELGQNLAHGANLSKVWVSGQVFEKDISKIHLSQKVQVFPSSTTEVYTGKIIFINPIIDSEQKSFAVKALVNNDHAKLKIGEFVQMKIDNQGMAEKAILLEKDSLTERNGKYYVYRKIKEFLVPTEVKISDYKYQDLLKIENGLTIGDEVVIEGVYLLPSQNKAENLDEHAHETKQSSKKEIPLWLWFAGGGILLLIAFLSGRATITHKKE